MPILHEIVTWSRERPLWQQDALRRLVEQPRLLDGDTAALVSLCKSEFGISVADGAPARPLSGTDAAAAPAGRTAAVRLTSVHSMRYVNALRDDQTLVVAREGITLVYGDNGSGKSGYVRVLKQLCRARGGRDAVHPNVYVDDALPASAVIAYELAAVPPLDAVPDRAAAIPMATHTACEATWGGPSSPPEELAQVSIFDSRSAAVYVTEENDVAYLPHGTDLFPKLVGVVGDVKSALESEIAALDRDRERFETIPVGTGVAEVLDNLHVVTARQRIDSLATLSAAECSTLDALRAEDRRFKAENPRARATELRLCVKRLAGARGRLTALEAALATSGMSELREAREALSTARAAAALASGGAFADAPVGGVGSDAWRALWQAARQFAELEAVPSEAFPPAADAPSARCVLCQQVLEPDARVRMARFEEFVQGETRAAVDRAARELDDRVAALAGLAPLDVADAALLGEIASLDSELAALLTECTAEMVRCRDTALGAARTEGNVAEWASYTARGADERLSSLETRVAAEAERFETAANPDARQAVEAALRELDARVALDGLRDRVYAEIERQALKAKLRKCVNSANTTAITKRNTEVLRDAVSQPLAEEFARQIVALDLTHLPIEVAASHGQKGRAYHAVALGKPAKKPRAPTEEVLSEGEHRCTALAAFFAEVSLQDSASTVVFDDPVSSLDHGRRKYVAQRLAAISRTRPVLVFTHDLVFLWMLQEVAERERIALAPRYFRRDNAGAGVITDEWPWDGQNVKTRVGVLKNALPAIRKLAGTNRRAYEREARAFYGNLRETWERAVEELLFNNAVRRFSPEVQTLRLRNLHRITEQQMETFEAGMTKTSQWIQGHDHAAELALPIPEPDELATDFDVIDRWVAELRKQNEAKKN